MYTLTNMKWKGPVLQLDITGEAAPEAAYLRYRAKLEKDRVQAEFGITPLADKSWRLTLDLRNVPWRVIYWEAVTVTKKGEELLDAVRLRNKIVSPLYDGKYIEAGGTYFVYPYITPERTLAFQYRERTKYDTLSFRIGEGFCYALYQLQKSALKKKHIILVYEKFCMAAQESGYYFFRYCMENAVEQKLGVQIYYIIDEKSPDLDRLAPYKAHLIPFMSLKHKKYLLAAKLLVSTDTKRHVYAWWNRVSLIMHFAKKKPNIFLQHGVTALKKVDHLYGKGASGDCRLFITTSEYEKNIIKEHFGYNDNEVAVTGFARWDALEDKSEGNRMVLVMPTWRNWLEEMTDEQFRESRYFKQYESLLGSDGLARMLEHEDVTLCFYLHPKFKDYIGNFASGNERIRLVAFGSEPLNELMMRCRLLVTDYSSVCWDVFYMGKPVIFFQFDLAEYLEAHGSYLDMENDLFGRRVTDSSQLLDCMLSYIRNGFSLEPEYEEKRRSYFQYIDKSNCKRICEEMQKLL